MNKINGFEVLKFIRNHKFIANIPVVMLTTSDADGDKKKAKALKAEYFVKPFNIVDLGKIMTSILSFFRIR